MDIALKSVSEKGYFDITTKNVDQAAATELNDYQVIVLISSNFKDMSDKLVRFLNSGKGLIIFPSSESASANFINSIKSLGLVISGSFVNIEKGQSVHFNEVDFNHPLFENIFVDEKKMQVESPDFYSYYKINPEGKGKTIINLEDESSFLSEYSLDEGKILVFSSSPVFKWSDFPLKSIFAPLVTKSVMYLSTKNSGAKTYFAGESITINISERTLPQIKVIRPDNTEEIINLPSNFSSNFFSYANTYLTGNYKFYSGGKLLTEVNVNADPTESVTEHISEADFDNYLEKINFRGRYFRINKGENPEQMIMQARFGSELWRYFLLAAILLALIEMTIARNAKKEIAGLTK